MNLTDKQIAELPISEGRAELLEDILRTDPRTGGGDRTPADLGSAERGWRMPLLAAAAVAALVIGGLAIASSTDDASRDGDGAPANTGGPSTESSAGIPVPTADWVWWEPEAGWAVREVAARASTDLRVTYDGPGGQVLEIHTYAANTKGLPRPGGRSISNPDGSKTTEVDLIDGSARVWQVQSTDTACNSEECATYLARVRRPANGSHLVVRLQPGERPVSAADFLEILEEVDSLDGGEFIDQLPPETVTPDEKREAMEGALLQVPFPSGLTDRQINDAVGGSFSPWLLRETAVREVVCGWEAQFQRGDRAAALGVLDSAKEWPAIKELATSSPEVAKKFTDAADRLRDPANNGDSGLGCP